MQDLLTEREHQISLLVATGASNKEIARQLGISSKTVRNVLTNVYTKTGIHTRTELAVYLVRTEFRLPYRPAVGAPAPLCANASCPFMLGMALPRRFDS